MRMCMSINLINTSLYRVQTTNVKIIYYYLLSRRPIHYYSLYFLNKSKLLSRFILQ